MSDIEITSLGILNLLKNLNVHKASGPDGISPKVLKELAEDIAPMLSLIFKKSYNTAEVPTDWLMLLLSTKWATKMRLVTTGQYRSHVFMQAL